MSGPRRERVPVDKRRKPFTLRQRRRMCQSFGNRPRNNWGCDWEGGLPAPWCEGDIVRLRSPMPDEGDGHPRLRGIRGPLCVVTYATSIGEGDEWYFRVEDGVYEGCSDRLHVIPPKTDWMSWFELVETPDPEGLALRGRMLAEGWSYTPPPTCEACGQRLPRSRQSGRQFQDGET